MVTVVNASLLSLQMENSTVTTSLDSSMDSERNYWNKLLSIYAAIFLACIATNNFGKCPVYLKRVSLVILLDATILITFPFIFTTFCAVLIVRKLVSSYLKYFSGSKLKLLNPEDVPWASEKPAQCTNFTSLYVLEGRCNVTDIQRRIQTQLIDKIVNGRRIYDRLKCRVVRKFGFYCWEKCENFKVENNVRLISNSEKEFYEQELFEALSAVADVPMVGKDPPWEILIVPTFIYDDKKKMGGEYYAVIFRVHHSIMDGVSAGHALKFALADKPVEFSVDPMQAPKMSLIVKYLLYLKALVLGPMLLLTALNVKDVNSFHQRVITGPKTFGWSRPVSMEALKRIKTITKTTTTAILMSAIGGALRNLAIKKNLPVPRRIYGAPTVAMLPYPDISPRNRFIVIHYILDIGMSSRLERLRSAHLEAARLSSSVEPLVIFATMKLGGRLPAAWADFLMGTLRATVLLSNVPGPAEKAYLFGGHALVDSVFWVPLRNWTGIGASLFSYAGRVRATFVTDHASLPESADMADLVAEFEREIVAMGEVAGLSNDTDMFWSSSE